MLLPYRKIAKVLFYLLLILWVSACSRPQTDVLRFGLASSPITLDPRLATDATSARINRLLYRRLVEFDESFTPTPSLADWQRVTSRHYRFILRNEGRHFHQGGYLNSSDVKATYDYILDEKNASPHRTILSVINRIDTPDENTIDFYLDKPDTLFPGYLVIGILPARLIEQGHSFNRNPVGSGPFRLLAWPEDGKVQLQRVGDNQTIEFTHIANPTVRVLKLIRGEIDMMQNDLLPELVTYLSKRNDVTVQKGAGSNFTYLGFNMDDQIVGKQQIREAIAYALDREAIIKYVMGGSARQANALLIPEHWAGNPALSFIEYNPQKARALLTQAGYDDEHPVKITYKTSSDPFRIRLATVIQNQLEKIGIKVDIRSYDWGTFYGDIKSGRFQMYSLSWVGIKTPGIFQYVFHSQSVPPNGANRGRYNNARADYLIQVAQASDNRIDMAASYQQLQTVLLQTLPYVPLWYEDQIFVSRNDIKGYNVAIDGNYDSLVHVRRADRMKKGDIN